MEERIEKRVHELYWNDDINCARTAIICLSELFETAIEPQTIWSAGGLHGVGGYRAQCRMLKKHTKLKEMYIVRCADDFKRKMTVMGIWLLSTRIFIS